MAVQLSARDKRFRSLSRKGTVHVAWVNSPEEREYRCNVLPRVGYVDDALEHLHIRLFYPNGEWPGCERACIDYVSAWEAISYRDAFDSGRISAEFIGYNPREYDNLQNRDVFGRELAYGGDRMYDAIEEWARYYGGILALNEALVPIQFQRRLAWLKQRFNDDSAAAEAWVGDDNVDPELLHKVLWCLRPIPAPCCADDDEAELA